jgi:hypothetical protein
MKFLIKLGHYYLLLYEIMSTCSHIITKGKNAGTPCDVSCNATVISCPLMGEIAVYYCKKHITKASEIKTDYKGKQCSQGTYDYFKKFCYCTEGWRKSGCGGYIACQA